MKNRDKWYLSPDDSRESWCFLLVTSSSTDEGRRLTGWILGTGNPARLVRTEQMQIDDLSSEDDLLESLWAELDDLRYEKTTLITPRSDATKLIRTRFLASTAIEKPSLRGLRHVALADVIDNYFSEPKSNPRLRRWTNSSDQCWGTKEECTQLIEELWTVRTEIGRLIPVRELRGEPL